MTILPTGTVTFLFTDLEGSTRLWEEHPDAMKEALARHDEILRDAIEGHSGHVVKMTGDGAHAVFADAPNAIDAAVAAQRTMTAEQWGTPGPLRVRMSVHTGRAEARDGDYFGTAVNRAARVMSAGHGGQIVVSLATEELVRDDLGTGISLSDLGEHRLRDLGRAERLFEVAAPGLTSGFAPLRSLDRYPTNLPIQLSSFVGRVAELTSVEKAITQSRIVTLTGVGGSGKTRLAFQAAANLLPDFADGAWVCELATANDAETLIQVGAASLGVSARPGTTLEESVLAFLRSREVLLVLDNCEHLLDAAGRFAEAVLHSCEHVRILATSREGLSIEGERVMPLRSLPIPAADADAIEVNASDAVRLFAERADAARSGFTVDAANAGAVGEICRRLDGMPLAIELAAARVASMRPVEMASLLDERFRLLTGGRRTAVERQQTLRATVDWSYSLLEERDRVVFDRLGVFAGSFDNAAATVIASGEDLESWDVLDALASLVAKSMIVDEEAADGTTRYSMLETLRQYARERLDQEADADAWRRRHAQYYATLSEEIAAGLQGRNELVWRPRFRVELDNLRAAVVWSVDASTTADVDLGLRIVTAFEYEVMMDRTAGVGSWAERAVVRLRGLSDTSRPGVLAAAAWHAWNRGDYGVTEELARAGIESADDNIELAWWAYAALMWAEWMQGRPDRGRAVLAEALDPAVSVRSNPYAYVALRNGAAFAEAQAGDQAAARVHIEEAVRLAREMGNPSTLASSLSGFGTVWLRDNPDAAVEAVLESIELTRRGAGDAAFANALTLAAVVRVHDDATTALQTLRESIVWSSRSGDQPSNVTTAQRAAHVFSVLGADVAAAVVMGVVGGPLARLNTLPAWERDDGIRMSQQLRSTLGDGEYEKAYTRGAAMSYDEFVDFMLGVIDERLAELDGE